MDDATVTAVSPPWGALPVEQYLIRNWDTSSSLPVPAQTRGLVASFLHNLAEIPSSWDATTSRGSQQQPQALDREPTPQEISTILAPWRDVQLRDVALQLWRDRHHGTANEAVWVRTYFPASDPSTKSAADDKFQEWIALDRERDPNFEEATLSWRILDDPSILSSGQGGAGSDDSWEPVFGVLPELAGPSQSLSRKPGGGNPALQEELDELRQQLQELQAAEGGEGDFEAETTDAGIQLQELAVGSFLLVADAHAFGSDRLRLLFLDARGNIVRESRILVGEIHVLKGEWFRSSWSDTEDWWLGGEVGVNYRADSAVGKELYGTT
ncbi:hypothetical protein SUNI508_00425 [Seiridium unicorne]|uniref:Uncharacterized protein n=1 Tax=Seiridium unicorne TaxID=138068 RepID=A0ABR2V6N4_9PEZI